MDHAPVDPEEVLALDSPCQEFLCPLNANVYGIDFQRFEIKDYDTGTLVYRVARDTDADREVSYDYEDDASLEGAARTVHYCFPEEFLKYKTVRTSLQFAVGGKPLNSFRMIERHYFKDELIRSYDFTFGFCIPNSVNTWEAIYPMPEYTEEQIADYVSNPFEHRSDSFYFVDGVLVMHNKAEYQYVADAADS